jgi:streptogrisin D
MLTAGHCARQLGDAIFQDGHFFGNMSIRTLVNNGLDRGVVTNATYDSLIFTGAFNATGPFDSSSAERVRGFVLVVEGISVCVDGSTHGEICGCKIGKRDFCTAIEGGGSTCHVTAVNKSGNIIIGGGDSGGPVFSRVSNGVTAVGTIIGNVTGHLDQGVIHELSFALPSGWQLLTR